MWSHDYELLKYNPVIGCGREKGFKRDYFSTFLVETQTQFKVVARNRRVEFVASVNILNAFIYLFIYLSI